MKKSISPMKPDKKPPMFAYPLQICEDPSGYWRARAEAAEKEIKSFEDFHPRAVKLLRKRKNFLVVAKDEGYYFWVYSVIREQEKQIGRWTLEDECLFQEAKINYYRLCRSQQLKPKDGKQ